MQGVSGLREKVARVLCYILDGNGSTHFERLFPVGNADFDIEDEHEYDITLNRLNQTMVKCKRWWLSLIHI